MGQIYKAFHPTLERDVAIKVIQVDQASNPTIVDRFRREAKVVAALRHPGIIQIFDFDVENDMLYMVMEFVQGESLAQRLAGAHAQGKRLPLGESLRLFSSITEATAYAHNHGVIHCDLKPGNVLLTTEEQPILTDFGIAKFISGQRLTATGDIVGTPHYMAPEQAAGGDVGAHTDVYALGVILYELVTGTLPFDGTTSMSIAFKHINEQPPSPREINPELPEALEQIIQKAMAKNSAHRYSTAQELLTAVERLMAVEPPATSPESTSFFICYKHHLETDKRLATHLHQVLTARGHQVYLDPGSEPGETTLGQIEQQIKASDFFILLLSEAAADSEAVESEIDRASKYHQSQGNPKILPVRVAYEGMLPYTTSAFLQPDQYIEWQNEADNEAVIEGIFKAIAGKYPQRPISPPPRFGIETSIISEDGRLIARDAASPPPLPAFDPRFLKELVVPGGAVKLRDQFYIERKADAHLKDQIIKWGTTTTIRAPRQTGKTSLLMRGIHYARQQGNNVVLLDFQSFSSAQLSSFDLFLQEFAQSVCDELDLDEETVEQAWRGSRSSTKKLTRFMEQQVLPACEHPIVLAMDEADSLLQTDYYKDFFGLLRSWHNRRASREIWEKLNLVLVISTEPYLLIDDIHQSPFNVGLHLGLTDFDEAQVRDLNLRHGSPVAENELPELMALLSGHPYLTRLALYTLVTEEMAWPDLQEQAPTDEGPFGDHLRRQYWIIYDKPDLKNALRDIIVDKCCPDEKALFRLLQAGLIKGSGDVYTYRCDLYKLYIKEKLL